MTAVERVSSAPHGSQEIYTYSHDCRVHTTLKWFKYRRRKSAITFLATGNHSSSRLPVGLKPRLLFANWYHRKDSSSNMEQGEPPSFYSPAQPADIEGIEINPDALAIDGCVPLGFEAYVWLPNPAWKWVEPDHEGAIAMEASDRKPSRFALPIKWSEVAAANGKQMTKHTRWHEICGPHSDYGSRALSPSQNWTWAPQEQNIEQSAVDILENVLSRWTSLDDRCLSGRWEGSSDWDTEVRLAFANWTYYVWSCRFGNLVDWLKQPNTFERERQMPHVIWPQDRSWFLAILYSGFSSYVAGPREMIDAILDSELEAYEVKTSDQVH